MTPEDILQPQVGIPLDMTMAPKMWKSCSRMAMKAKGASICLETISMNDWARLGKAAPKPSATRAGKSRPAAGKFE
eukprot:482000-Pyramimonas_sp.AAC.1